MSAGGKTTEPPSTGVIPVRFTGLLRGTVVGTENVGVTTTTAPLLPSEVAGEVGGMLVANGVLVSGGNVGNAVAVITAGAGVFVKGRGVAVMTTSTRVFVGVLVGIGVLLGAVVLVGAVVGARVGVFVGRVIRVGAAVRVAVLVTVFVAVGVLVGVNVGVLLNVLVNVLVGVCVVVLVGRFVAVPVLVWVAVFVGVCVTVFVAVLLAVLLAVIVCVGVSVGSKAICVGVAELERVGISVGVAGTPGNRLHATDAQAHAITARSARFTGRSRFLLDP
jgi:hypothetical protein